MSIYDTINKDKLYEYRNTFDLFDKDKDGIITINELEDVLKAEGIFPTKSKIEEIKNEISSELQGKIEFNKFIEILQNLEKQNPKKEDLIEIIKQFDTNNKGTIKISELKEALTTMGDKIEEKVFDEIMKMMKIEDDEIEYESFIEKLININKS